MPALRQATGLLCIDFCKRSQLTKQVGSCQRGVTLRRLTWDAAAATNFSATAAAR